MRTQTKHFYQLLIKCLIGICVIMFTDFADAAVVSRGKPSATKNAARASAASTVTVSAPAPVAEVTPQPVATEPTQPEIKLENKSNMFSDAFGTSDSDDDDNDSRDMLARIAAFRAKQNVSDTTTKSGTQKSGTAPGTNKCDQDLRKCMAQKCGSGFQNCAGDTDTIWGDKMDACRRSTTCTGHEYAMFTPEIKADRDIMQQLSLYESIMNCGNSYNDCIVGACGSNFEKCIKKSDAEAATKQCQQIAKDCQEQDSGLSARAIEAMTSAHNISEYTVAHDEKRLYALRDKMREACGTLNAAFDERTFSCVFTVNFRAGEDDSIFASKKAYVGSTFNCDQNWFGVDVTTFMENAFRLTRSQKGASAAMLGAGIGTAAGAITSGAIDRAVDRHKAERDYKEELCDQTGGKWNKTTKLCNCPKGQKWDKETGCAAKNTNKDKNQDEETNQDDSSNNNSNGNGTGASGGNSSGADAATSSSGAGTPPSNEGGSGEQGQPSTPKTGDDASDQTTKTNTDTPPKEDKPGDGAEQGQENKIKQEESKQKENA